MGTNIDINKLKIQDLKRAVRRAVRRAGFSEDHIRNLGDLRCKATWRDAYRLYCQQRLPDKERELLFGFPNYQVSLNGQFLIFPEVTDEPPDPDDFGSPLHFNNEWKRWEEANPEEARALRLWAQLEVIEDSSASCHDRSVKNRTPIIAEGSRSPPSQIKCQINQSDRKQLLL